MRRNHTEKERTNIEYKIESVAIFDSHAKPFFLVFVLFSCLHSCIGVCWAQFRYPIYIPMFAIELEISLFIFVVMAVNGCVCMRLCAWNVMRYWMSCYDMIHEQEYIRRSAIFSLYAFGRAYDKIYSTALRLPWQEEMK